MSETTGKNVVERMIDVMREVGSIGKDRKAPGLAYAFRGIDDITPVVQPLFVKHGVILTMRVIDREREIVTTSKGAAMVSVRLLVEHTFRAPDMSTVVTSSLGEAMDQMDKASNKAMTAALKATLTTSFTIPVNDPEADTEASPQVEIAHPKAAAPRPAAKGPANKPTAVAAPIGPSGRIPTFDELAKEVGVLKGLIQTAPNREALDLLTPRLKSLPESDRDALRPLFNARLGEVTKGAA